MSDKLDEWDMAILAEAWEYLQREDLAFALQLEKQVKTGKSPEQLVRRFLGLAGEHRGPKAKRIENAAKYLEATSK